jgi:hypothetical protein
VDSNVVVIITGLIAALVVYAAVQDSWNGWEGTVGPMTWSFSKSWITTSAAIVAIVYLFSFYGEGSDVGASAVFGFILLFVPLIYQGLGGGAASKKVFFLVGTLLAWAIFTLILTAVSGIPSVVAGYAIVPRLVLDSVMIVTLLAAIVGTGRVLTAAASGNGTETWTLP